MRLELDELVIEVTRRCNIQCSHCLRGDAQAVDISPDVVGRFIRKNGISTATTVIFTGGEPLLRPQLILDIMNLFDKYLDASPLNYYLVTNGTIFNRKVAEVITEMHLRSDDDSDAFSVVEISNDDYHEYAIYSAGLEEVAERVKRRLLKIYRRVESRSNNLPYVPIASGRAKEFGAREPDRVEKLAEYLEIDRYDDDLHGCIYRIYGAPVYLAATGNVLLGCDFSYDYIDSTEGVDLLKLCEGKERKYEEEEEEVQSCIAR